MTSGTGALFVILNRAPNLKILGLLQASQWLSVILLSFYSCLESHSSELLKILSTGFCCWSYAKHILLRLGT